jgi:hypothetical protein
MITKNALCCGQGCQMVYFKTKKYPNLDIYVGGP